MHNAQSEVCEFLPLIFHHTQHSKHFTFNIVLKLSDTEWQEYHQRVPPMLEIQFLSMAENGKQCSGFAEV